MTDFNAVIIGSGVVGLACAEYISARLENVIVIEQHNSIGNETSSRNSEVIHAGLYYQKNSLKAEMCVCGNESLYKYCEENNVAYNKCGKYVISSKKEDDYKLDKIYQNAVLNNVRSIRYAELDEMKENEPEIICTKALYSENTGIVNSHELMTSLKNNSEKSGCDYAFNHKVFKINRENDYYRIFIIDNEGFDFEITSKIVINSAGLESDNIANMIGIDIYKYNYNLNYVRGHYFKLAPKYKNKINHLIYPVPSNDLGVGIHITLDLAGYLKLGPDTEILKNKIIEYKVDEKLVDKFFIAGSSYIRNLSIEEIFPDQSGIRPKLQKSNEGFRDFIISEESGKGLPNFVNLIGIESPGLTCSLEIGKYVGKILSL